VGSIGAVGDPPVDEDLSFEERVALTGPRFLVHLL
jgi:hypothetical protein